MQVAVRKLLVFLARRALAARIGPQAALGVVVVHAVLAVEILCIGNGKRQTARSGLAQEHLGVADTPRIDNFGQVIGRNYLSNNIFKLHNTRKLIYKITNNIKYGKKKLIFLQCHFDERGLLYVETVVGTRVNGSYLKHFIWRS